MTEFHRADDLKIKRLCRLCNRAQHLKKGVSKAARQSCYADGKLEAEPSMREDHQGTDGCMDGGVDGGMHGWRGGWQDAWLEGWMAGCRSMQRDFKKNAAASSRLRLLLFSPSRAYWMCSPRQPPAPNSLRAVALLCGRSR